MHSNFSRQLLLWTYFSNCVHSDQDACVKQESINSFLKSLQISEWYRVSCLLDKFRLDYIIITPKCPDFHLSAPKRMLGCDHSLESFQQSRKDNPTLWNWPDSIIDFHLKQRSQILDIKIMKSIAWGVDLEVSHSYEENSWNGGIYNSSLRQQLLQNTLGSACCNLMAHLVWENQKIEAAYIDASRNCHQGSKKGNQHFPQCNIL